nr:RNA-directed DNA polymerase [Thermoleophilaceae bacterium]
MHDRHTFAQLSGPLADAFLAGPWNETALVIRAGQVLEPPPAWIDSLVRAVLAAYVRRPGDRPRELAAYIDLQLREMRPVPGAPAPRVRRWLVAELAMGRRPWPVPEIPSVGALAEYLGLEVGRLDWLADAKGLERTVAGEKLR